MPMLTPLVAITGRVGDPHWHWWIVCYFFFGGITGGAFLIAAIADLFSGHENRSIVRAGYLLAAPLGSICGLLLILDLGQPLRFWHMMFNPVALQPAFKYWSPMSYGTWIVGAFSFAAVLAFFAVLAEWRGYAWGALLGKIAGAIGLLFAMLLISYTGVLLNATNQQVWGDNLLLGALFAASGVSTGLAAIVLALVLSRQRNHLQLLRLERADIMAMVVELVLLIALLVVLVSAGSGASLYAGWLAPFFWGGVLLVGLVLPLVLYLRPRLLGPATVLIAAVLTLVGGFILRAVILFSAHA